MGGGIAPTYESLWAGAAPISFDASTSAIVTANRVRFNVSGIVLALRYYRQAADSGAHVMYLRKIGPGTLERTVRHAVYNPVGAQPARWETKYLTPTLKVVAGETYQVGMIQTAGRRCYMIGAHFPDADLTIGNFTLPADAAGALNGANSVAVTFNPQTTEGAAKLALDFFFKRT